MTNHSIFFFDIETSQKGEIKQLAALSGTGASLKTASRDELFKFVSNTDYLCGHNIFLHDLNYLPEIEQNTHYKKIDTLFLSALIFSYRPYHALVKDYKLVSEELSNPLHDASLARDLFYDCVSNFHALPTSLQQIYFSLLRGHPHFSGFFEFIGFSTPNMQNVHRLISYYFRRTICENCDIEKYILETPVALAYAISQLDSMPENSTSPAWVIKNFTDVPMILKKMRGTSCGDLSCQYCRDALGAVHNLQRYFGYESYRRYDDLPLQQQAVECAISGDSLIALFPTGGGKSVTFQVPALVAHANERALTVVISPLQSLMKDQVDNLEKKHITHAVTINGGLNPLERSVAIENVENGNAALLYLSPESLRSRSIQNMLLGRNIARFVIDEAHCFSSWGHDFRVDYLYIGEFIKNLCDLKKQTIPVSCFSATAKQEVIADISDYFKKHLAIQFTLFQATAERKNLNYFVIPAEAEQKNQKLQDLLDAHAHKPTIIYCSRTKKTQELATFLNERGYQALAYHGQMDRETRTENQNAFMNDDVAIVVATTAFGMGVDKDNVGLVIHYDISNSIENYVQEAGRAGRDQNLRALCYILLAPEDLDKHFTLLNQTRINKKEINEIWRGIKDLTREYPSINASGLDIARKGGWDDSVSDIETRVRTAINSLEQSEHIKRGFNAPKIYANSILVKSMMEASQKIESSTLTKEDKEKASRLMTALFTAKKATTSAGGEENESRLDYLADRLAIPLQKCVDIVAKLRELHILTDDSDMTAVFKLAQNTLKNTLQLYLRIELFLVQTIGENPTTYETGYLQKEYNKQHPQHTLQKQETIDHLLNYFSYKHIFDIKKKGKEREIAQKHEPEKLAKAIDRRYAITGWILGKLRQKQLPNEKISFSVLGLVKDYNHEHVILGLSVTVADIEDCLYFIDKLKLVTLEGGFLVIYQRMNITKLAQNNKQYTDNDYKALKKFYEHKTQAVHIVGKYANLLAQDSETALSYVKDYFELEYKAFLKKHFTTVEQKFLSTNMSQTRYHDIFGSLSSQQLAIIEDNKSHYLVILAGPGSGKTKVLVHKLASLLQLEDVKHEQLLMLTFSRAAASEFKQRLKKLIGNAAHFVDIKTFHSFCFDIVGEVGKIEKDNDKDIIKKATQYIAEGVVDDGRVRRSVLVIDEAQDMSAEEFALVTALIENNPDMRVIAVGDDDQNIYSFRGSDSRYFTQLSLRNHSRCYELLTNYRSSQAIVQFTNTFAKHINGRLKQNPSVAHLNLAGKVAFTNLSCVKNLHIEIPMVQSFLQQKDGLSGTVCFVVPTNELALKLTGVLRQHKIKVTPMVKNEFNLLKLDEIHFFAKAFDTDTGLSIAQSKWEQAKQRLQECFSTSRNLELANTIISTFEAVVQKGKESVKYKSDFYQFVRESKSEDFLKIQGQDALSVYVSTIHQTKGKEFDHLFVAAIKDEPRELYVAFTRAKRGLYIFNTIRSLDALAKFASTISVDHQSYDTSVSLNFELTLRDIYLDSFKTRQTLIGQLCSGDKLTLDKQYRLCTHDGVVLGTLSSSARERLDVYASKGYAVKRVVVRNVIWWGNKQDETEDIRIVLPWIEMTKGLDGAK